MDLTNSSAVVTGGASGLGLATVDAPGAWCRGNDRRPAAVAWKDVASRLGDLVTFGAAVDVRDAAAVDAALDLAGRAPLRTLVHCAGRGGRSAPSTATGHLATTTCTRDRRHQPRGHVQRAAARGDADVGQRARRR